MTHNGLPLLSQSDLARVEPWERPVDGQVAELEQSLIKIRRHLHAHPEPSCEERETSRFLAGQLNAAGIGARVCRDGLGVMADLELGDVRETTPRIALRADIDALKLQDLKTTPYRSQKPGLCHACGHDAHSTMVLGAALCCAELRRNGALSNSSGLRLRFVFQPAEEESVGAQWMVEQGAVDDVDAILGLHVDPERTLGTVGVRYGTLTAACDDVEIIVEGQGHPHYRDRVTLIP